MLTKSPQLRKNLPHPKLFENRPQPRTSGERIDHTNDLSTEIACDVPDQLCHRSPPIGQANPDTEGQGVGHAGRCVAQVLEAR